MYRQVGSVSSTSGSGGSIFAAPSSELSILTKLHALQQLIIFKAESKLKYLTYLLQDFKNQIKTETIVATSRFH